MPRSTLYSILAAAAAALGAVAVVATGHTHTVLVVISTALDAILKAF